MNASEKEAIEWLQNNYTWYRENKEWTDTPYYEIWEILTDDLGMPYEMARTLSKWFMEKGKEQK